MELKDLIGIFKCCSPEGWDFRSFDFVRSFFSLMFRYAASILFMRCLFNSYACSDEAFFLLTISASF